MLSIYACTLLICAASLVAGRAILALLGARRPAWLSGATGFAALVVVAPLLLRLPGPRDDRGGHHRRSPLIAAAAIVACATCAPRGRRAPVAAGGGRGADRRRRSPASRS